MRYERTMSVLGAVFGALLMLVLLSPNAKADEWNKLTYVQFSAPVEIPGYNGPIVLPAGTYTFKLLNSMSDRDIVQIYSKDQSHLYSTVLAIPDYRLRPRGKTVIKFAEEGSGNPEALKAWFYPGSQFGVQFVYPKSRAVELAKASKQPVLSMSDEDSANMSKPIKSGQEEAAQSLGQAKVNAEEPSGKEVEMGQVVQSQPSNSSSAAAQKQ
jgi:hypothetical protein